MSQYLTGQSRKGLEKQRNRKAILQSARTVFAERGYDGSTLDQIALRAGFAKGTIYLYFSSKEELFLSIMEEEIGRFVDIVRKVKLSHGCPSDRLSSLVQEVLTYLEAHKDFFRIFTPEQGGLTEIHHPELRRRILPKYRRALSLTSALIREGMQQREIRKSDPLTLAHALTGLVNAMVGRWLLEDCRGSLTKYSRTIISVFFDGVRRSTP